MTINLADNDPRVSYAVAAGATQSSFTVSFEFFVDADLNVYVDGVLKTLTTDYTVTGGDGSTGSISMSVTGASGGSTVVITRDIDIERATDFPSSGPFDIASLNEELDKLVAISADLKDSTDRALQLTDYDTQVSLLLPDVNTRKGKLLAFNATTGAVEAGASTAGATTVAALATDIETLADIEDGTNATDAISDLAAIASDVSAVAGISSAVTGVNNISAAVTAVNNDASDIGTVSTNIASVNTVATNIADVITVANDLNEAISEIETAADDLNEAVSEIDTVSANIANVNTVGNDISGSNTIGTVAGSISNVNTAATNISGINTAASSISAINDFNDIFFAGSTAPSSPSAGDLWYDTANSKLKVYVAGSGFQEAGAYLEGLTNTHIFTAIASQTDFTTDDASNTMSIYANGNTLVFKNGVRLMEGTSSTNDYYIDGNTVKLNEACGAGDVLLVEVFTKISLTQETSLNALVTTAQGHANTASTHATTATTQATTATTQATAASTSATNAATSATNAATSATNASTSETNASTSETNAANSASAAATSASQAQAAANFDVLNDTTPQLGGSLDVNGNAIVSVSNGDIEITPNGTGAVVIDGLSHPTSDGTSGQFMKTDGAGNLSFGTVSTPTLSSLGLDNHDQLSVNSSGDVALGSSEINFGTNGWSIEISSTDLVFKYNGTAKIKFASDGEIVTVDDVTAFGTV